MAIRVTKIGGLKLTSQKNSLPRRPQNQEIQDTSSELLIVIGFYFDLHLTLFGYEKNTVDVWKRKRKKVEKINQIDDSLQMKLKKWPNI